MTDLKEDVLAAKEATRELHEAIQGYREVLKEIKAATENLTHSIEQQVVGMIKERTDIELASLAKQTNEAIERAERAVMKRFEEIGDLLLAETKKDKRSGRASIPEIAHALVEGRADLLVL